MLHGKMKQYSQRHENEAAHASSTRKAPNLPEATPSFEAALIHIISKIPTGLNISRDMHQVTCIRDPTTLLA